MTVEQAIAEAWPSGLPARPLRTIEQAVKVGTVLQYSWFRGHSQPHALLLPAIHRDIYASAPPNVGYRAGQRFRLRARSFVNAVPAWTDYLSWLLLMQHHRAPTRLLDWSENVLVALYFATSSPVEQPGELWCLDPSELNGLSNLHVCGPEDVRVEYLAAEVFVECKKLPDLAKELGLDGPYRLPIALVPAFEFPRMAAQLSRFTIHASKEPQHLIEFLLRSTKHLVRYVVPPECKEPLRRDLMSLGISHETLFASLEGLAETIKEEILWHDFIAPEPPEFD